MWIVNLVLHWAVYSGIFPNELFCPYLNHIYKVPLKLIALVCPRYYISLMDVSQNLIFITSYYFDFKLLMILFSILKCLLKVTFFWKTMFVVIYAKTYHRFIPTIYENFKSVFFNHLVHTKTCLIWVIEGILIAILRYFHWIAPKQMDIISKMQKIRFTENYYM